MLRIFGRLVLAMLFFLVFAVAIWLWMARGCSPFDPSSLPRPAANCADKANTAKLAWFLGFLLPIFWAVQPKERRQAPREKG